MIPMPSEACTSIKDQVPSVKIVMLTISDEEEDLFEAIKAGATGYLLKDVSIDEVADVVRAVHDGQSFISPSMASKLITEFAVMAKRGDERQQQVPAPKLTDREMEVLRLVVTLTLRYVLSQGYQWLFQVRRIYPVFRNLMQFSLVRGNCSLQNPFARRADGELITITQEVLRTSALESKVVALSNVRDEDVHLRPRKVHPKAAPRAFTERRKSLLGL